MSKKYNVEIHAEGNSAVMQLRDCNESFIRMMIVSFVNQLGYGVDYSYIQIPDDADSYSFIAYEGGDARTITVTYLHCL